MLGNKREKMPEPVKRARERRYRTASDSERINHSTLGAGTNRFCSRALIEGESLTRLLPQAVLYLSPVDGVPTGIARVGCLYGFDRC